MQLEKAFIAAGPPRRFESLVNVRRSGSADVESEPARPATRRLTYRNWQAKQLERLSLAVDTDLDTNSGSGSGHRCVPMTRMPISNLLAILAQSRFGLRSNIPFSCLQIVVLLYEMCTLEWYDRGITAVTSKHLSRLAANRENTGIRKST